MAVNLRAATLSDAETCGRNIYTAFKDLADHHRFPPDFPAPEVATQLAHSLIANPAVFGVVAEEDGRVVGSNFLSESDPIRGVGPITVAPDRQGSGIGRQLMHSVLERANGAVGVRLLQDGFNMHSLALYALLGFEVREPVAVMVGRPSSQPAPTVAVRPMTQHDLSACEALCLRIHGIPRAGELSDALRLLGPMIAEREGRIVGYMTAPTFWIANHGLAESEDDMKAMILGAAAVQTAPLSFLLPTRQANLFRWCLDQGLRTVKPMTLMTKGAYQSPNGSYMPSVFY